MGERMRLAGRTAVVTGAAGGIGRPVAEPPTVRAAKVIKLLGARTHWRAQYSQREI